MNKKRTIIVTIIIILIIILGLWISGIIPKQIARISATTYLKMKFPKKQYEYVDIEWSSSFGGYSIKFKDENDKTVGFIMNNKYFPISPGQGTFAQEDRTIKYKTYEKTGVWNYGNSQYWVAYNGELPDGDTQEYMLNSEELFIIAIIN